MKSLESRVARLENLVQSKGIRSDLESTTEIEVGWSFYVSGEIAQDNIGDLIYNEEEILYTWRDQGLIDSEGNITDKGQELLVQDMRKVEDGCIKWLEDTFGHAVADGHVAYGDLVGRVWINLKNPNHIKEMSGEFLNSNESVLNSSSGSLDWSIFEGASEFGQSLLDASLTFYKEGLEDILDR